MTGMALKPLVAACLLSTLSTALNAAPNPYSTMVVFGDSLSDAGQFPDQGGPPGSTLRFTNRVGPTYQNGSGEIFGPVTPMLLGGKLGIAAGDLAASTSPVNAQLGSADGNNWAVGGNRTDQIFDSISAPGGSVVANGGITLRSRDGYLVDRASQGLGADPNALYYLTGGGNDFLQGRILNELQAQQAAGRLVDGVEALQGAGARYIMVWLLPDLGLTPATFGTPRQFFASQLSTAFNTTLTAQLSQVNANIIPLNIPLLVRETLATPGAFGLAGDQNLVGTCFSGNGCAMNPTYGLNGTTPDPTKLLFNDSVHPTIAGQRLIADYAYSLLAAPWEVTLLPEMAHGTLRAYQDELRNQWQADWENWQSVGQWRAFVAGGGQHLDFDSQDSAASGDGNGYNLTLGGSYRIDDAWRAGIAAGIYQQELEAGAEDSEYNLNSYLATAFVQYQENRWWADAALTGGYLDYDDLKRKFALGGGTRSEKGDTDGYLWAFGARLGYDIAQQADSPWHLSPFVSADYARVEVDGYAEDGASSTSLSYDDQKRDSKRLGAGLQGLYAFGSATRVFAEYAFEREYEDDTQDLTLSLNSLPDNRFTLEGFTPQDHLNRVTLGFSQQLAPDLALRGGYNWRKGEDDTQQGVNLALSLDF